MYHPPPMSPGPRMALRSAFGAAALLLASTVACTTAVEPTPSPSPSVPATPTPTPVPTPSPTPTPEPTLRFTNPPDAELRDLFPATVGGVPLVVASPEEVALTPGDVGLVFGEIGLRFASLAVAYLETPRLAAYAVRVDDPSVTTAELEPYLAAAGRYVGIAGLDPEPWELTQVGPNVVWTRGGDLATGRSATIYTWASGEFVFLLIGSSDAHNRELVAALPGQPPPSASEPPPSPSEAP